MGEGSDQVDSPPFLIGDFGERGCESRDFFGEFRLVEVDSHADREAGFAQDGEGMEQEPTDFVAAIIQVIGKFMLHRELASLLHREAGELGVPGRVVLEGGVRTRVRHQQGIIEPPRIGHPFAVMAALALGLDVGDQDHALVEHGEFFQGESFGKALGFPIGGVHRGIMRERESSGVGVLLVDEIRAEH